MLIGADAAGEDRRAGARRSPPTTTWTRPPLLICVLKGAVMFLTDFARALPIPSELEFMAVTSYGSATSSSGVVRILKDLDRDITGRRVVIVEDIIDSGLTLSWLLRNLATRGPARRRRRPAAQARGDQGRGRRPVRRVRHPHRFRRRLRARLRRALPRPAVRRAARRAHVPLTAAGRWGTDTSGSGCVRVEFCREPWAGRSARLTPRQSA